MICKVNFEINEEDIKDNLLTLKLKGIKNITNARYICLTHVTN